MRPGAPSLIFSTLLAGSAGCHSEAQKEQEPRPPVELPVLEFAVDSPDKIANLVERAISGERGVVLAVHEGVFVVLDEDLCGKTGEANGASTRAMHAVDSPGIDIVDEGNPAWNGMEFTPIRLCDNENKPQIFVPAIEFNHGESKSGYGILRKAWERAMDWAAKKVGNAN